MVEYAIEASKLHRRRQSRKSPESLACKMKRRMHKIDQGLALNRSKGMSLKDKQTCKSLLNIQSVDRFRGLLCCFIGPILLYRLRVVLPDIPIKFIYFSSASGLLGLCIQGLSWGLVPGTGARPRIMPSVARIGPLLLTFTFVKLRCINCPIPVVLLVGLARLVSQISLQNVFIGPIHLIT